MQDRMYSTDDMPNY